VVRDGSLLGLNLCNAALDVGALPVALVHARDEVRSVGEQVIHLLKRALRGLRQEAVEEDGISEVAHLQISLARNRVSRDNVTYNKQNVEPPPNALHGNTGDLSDHGVQTERSHRSDSDTLRTCLRVENLGGDDPGQRSTGGAETEVVDPGDHDESPSGSAVVARTGREHGEQNRGDDEGDHVSKVTEDQGPAPTEMVDEKDTQSLSDQSNDGRDGLVLQSVVTSNSHLAVDLDRVVLNCRDTGHLDGTLNGAGEEKTAETRPVGK
jgi:hypothetical protein